MSSLSLDRKTTEIKQSIDEYWRRLTRWIEDSNGTAMMPEGVKLALSSANLACSGDIPECCRKLATVCVPRMVEEMRRFIALEPDAFTRIGGTPIPTPRFWAAAKALRQARDGAESPIIEVLEPVEELLKQGVSHDQIAFHIYGRRGEGPFVTNSRPDVAKIKKQAEYEKQMRENGEAKIEPVIPENWIPPWCLPDEEKRQQELKQELQALDRLEHPRRYEDPATVEEMLQEGAFIQQIEKAKTVEGPNGRRPITRDEILAIAHRIGVFAKDAPGFSGARAMTAEDENQGPATPDNDALRELVIESYVQSGGTKGSGDIARELREAGYDIKSQQVGSIIQHYKREQKEQSATAG